MGEGGWSCAQVRIWSWDAWVLCQLGGTGPETRHLLGGTGREPSCLGSIPALGGTGIWEGPGCSKDRAQTLDA